MDLERILYIICGQVVQVHVMYDNSHLTWLVFVWYTSWDAFLMDSKSYLYILYGFDDTKNKRGGEKIEAEFCRHHFKHTADLHVDTATCCLQETSKSKNLLPHMYYWQPRTTRTCQKICRNVQSRIHYRYHCPPSTITYNHVDVSHMHWHHTTGNIPGVWTTKHTKLKMKHTSQGVDQPSAAVVHWFFFVMRGWLQGFVGFGGMQPASLSMWLFQPALHRVEFASSGTIRAWALSSCHCH